MGLHRHDAPVLPFEPGMERDEIGHRSGAWLLPTLLGWIVGSAMQLQQPQLWATWVYGCCVLPALFALAWRAIKNRAIRRFSAHLARAAATASTDRITALTAALLAAALAFGTVGLRASRMQAEALEPALQGRDLSVTGVVAALPQPQPSGLRFLFEVESAQHDGVALRLPGRLLLSWYGVVLLTETDAGNLQAELQQRIGDLRAGQRWQLTVRLKSPHGNRNPHGFDTELWLWERGVQATGYVRAGRHDVPPQRLDDAGGYPVERARQQVRAAIYQHLAGSPAAADAATESAPDAAAAPARQRSAGIVAALVVGDQAAIERPDWELFRVTGVAHLMSISGLHITLFAWLAARLIDWLWRRSARLCLALPAVQAGLLGGVLLALAYALFSGWGVPAQRTVWMLACVALLRALGLRWPWPMVWLLAAALVLALDPWALLQAGFWLSFVAVAILFASDPARPPPAAPANAADSAVRRSWFAIDSIATRAALTRTLSIFVGFLREQSTISLALAPLSLLLFQQVSIVGLLANALAIPWVTLVVTPLALGGVLWPPLWQAAALALAALLALLQHLAQWPLASLTLPAAPLWAALAALLGGVWLVLRLPWSLRLLGLPLLLPALLWQVPRPPVGQFELLAADIGQGNAVLVRTASHSLLYDSGPRLGLDSDAGQRVLLPLLRALGERLDRVVLSHRDSDHTGGALAIQATQPQADWLGAALPAPAPGQATPHSVATPCLAGQRWRWDGVLFEVLHPRAQDHLLATKPNALSCVLRIGNDQNHALLVGDIEQPQEARLLAELGSAMPATRLRADLLLVPHHGSKTSSSAPFLQAVAPRFALVQAGYRNRFGHPAAAVVRRYQQHGITLLRSDDCGAALWQSVQPAQVVCQRQLERRYWQYAP